MPPAKKIRRRTKNGDIEFVEQNTELLTTIGIMSPAPAPDAGDGGPRCACGEPLRSYAGTSGRCEDCFLGIKKNAGNRRKNLARVKG